MNENPSVDTMQGADTSALELDLSEGITEEQEDFFQDVAKQYELTRQNLRLPFAK